MAQHRPLKRAVLFCQGKISGQKIDVLEVPALPQGEEMAALSPLSGMSEQEVAIGAERLFPAAEAAPVGTVES